MFPYALSKYFGWEATIAYFSPKPIQAPDFEKHVRLIYLGKESEYKKARSIGVRWIGEHAQEYDVLMLFNYGSTSYRLARAAKKVNPAIKVWCKFDMGAGGFSHWWDDGTLGSKIRRYREAIVSRSVDLFTVECSHYYEALKNVFPLKGRLAWLPNGFSLYQIDAAKLENIPKENIVLTVGRLGTNQKNTELLLASIARLSQALCREWKFYLVGSVDPAFAAYRETFMASHPELTDCIVWTGETSDRQGLYELYARAKIFALPSRWEGFCLAGQEAISQGCYPVVTHYSAAVYEQVKNEHCGTIVEEQTAEAFSAALREAMERESLPHEEIRAYARENFSYPDLARRLDGLLMDLMKQ